MPTLEAEAMQGAERAPATFADYVALARPDHWPKHVFILPGVALASTLHGRPLAAIWLPFLIGLTAAAAVASANYVLNEWLDARDDAFHPIKSRRPAVTKRLSRGVVYAEYVGLAAVGLWLASVVSHLFLWTSMLFLASGVLYNVRPLRTKERVYLDVTSEAINNPLRLTLGWAMVDSSTLPPSSLLVAYWMGGAFLMALKRLAEYRSAEASGHLASLGRYRRSFRYYSERTLLLSAFLYAQMAAFFLAVFLIKYRIEYLLTMPVIAVLFAIYLRLALKRDSPVQAPERLYRERSLMLVLAVLVLVFVVFTWVDVPILERLTDPHYIRISG